MHNTDFPISLVPKLIAILLNDRQLFRLSPFCNYWVCTAEATVCIILHILHKYITFCSKPNGLCVRYTGL
jgi:hypothetical protein